jgi:Na+/H+ antiporter NhaD/arsenite permease-like protein
MGAFIDSLRQAILDFWACFNLFNPSVINYLNPATIMSLFVSTEQTGVQSGSTKMKLAEWDTLFYFYGVILCVGNI